MLTIPLKVNFFVGMSGLSQLARIAQYVVQFFYQKTDDALTAAKYSSYHRTNPEAGKS